MVVRRGKGVVGGEEKGTGKEKGREERKGKQEGVDGSKRCVYSFQIPTLEQNTATTKARLLTLTRQGPKYLPR